MISSAPCMGGAAWTKAADLVGIRVGNDQGLRIGRVERAAHPGHEGLSDVAPVRKRGVKVGAQLCRAQVQHAWPAAGSERIENALLHGGGQPWPSSGGPGWTSMRPLGVNPQSRVLPASGAASRESCVTGS